MTTCCATRPGCAIEMKPMMPMMPMTAPDENSLPFRGGSGWGMSTRARSAWQGQHIPSRRRSQSASKTCFPAKAGTQTGLPPSRENKETAVSLRRIARPYQIRQPPPTPQRTEKSQTPRPALADTLIRCPTRASERTLSGCPTPPLSRMHHPRPRTPLSPPISGDVQNAVRL